MKKCVPYITPQLVQARTNGCSNMELMAGIIFSPLAAHRRGIVHCFFPHLIGGKPQLHILSSHSGGRILEH